MCVEGIWASICDFWVCDQFVLSVVFCAEHFQQGDNKCNNDLQAELKILSEASRAAAELASRSSPPRTAASCGSAPHHQNEHNASNPYQSSTDSPNDRATASSQYTRAASATPGSFRHQHQGTYHVETDSDSSLPGLIDDNSDTSPTFSSSPEAFTGYSNGNGAASSSHSVSDQSSPVSHHQTHRGTELSPGASGSGDSDGSPCLRHWPNSNGRAGAGNGNGHAAKDQGTWRGSASTSAADSSYAESADPSAAGSDRANQGVEQMYQPAQTKQQMDAPSTFFKQSAEAFRDHDWQTAVRLFEY